MTCALDSGEGKRELCLSLGAEKYIDFAESKDIIADVKATCGELGAHVALITTASVSKRCNQRRVL